MSRLHWLTMWVGLASATHHRNALEPPLFHDFTVGFQGLMQRGSIPRPRDRAALPGEAAQFTEAANFARDNVAWSDVETTRGEYNWTETDLLLKEYSSVPHPPRWMLTLAYGNPLYDGGSAPRTLEGVSAFVAFVVATVKHYRGHSILWEIWCEPNSIFWSPQGGNVTQYIALVKSIAAGVAQANLINETFIGPNSAMWWEYDVDVAFLEECFKAGLLDFWAAVNLHLYRASPPETVQDSYRKVKSLVNKYTRSGEVPKQIISGEWGYSTCIAPCSYFPYTGQVDGILQAKYLARQWLVNAMEGVASIWCKFFDGPDVTEMGDGLGVVGYHYDTATKAHTPKLSYMAARVIMQMLRGAKFVVKRISAKLVSPKQAPGSYSVDSQKKLPGTGPNGISVMGYHSLPSALNGSAFYVLRFSFDDSSTREVFGVWNIAGPTSIQFEAAPGCFAVVDMLGNSRDRVCTIDGLVCLSNVTDAPVYVQRLSKAESLPLMV